MSDEIRQIGIGMLGYAFMGRAHTNGYRTLAYQAWPPPLRPRLVSIAGRNEQAVSEAARQLGFERHVTDWRELVADPEVELFDNSGPNALHAEPTVAAAEAGKHVVCEKPLGRDASESYDLWKRVEAAGVVHLCAFNYRFVPAVRLARQLLEAGELGEIQHFRGRYLQDWGATDAAVWRFEKEAAGSGALGDLGAHVIDLARYLGCEPATVSAVTATFRPGREVDDAFEASVSFTNGAVGRTYADCELVGPLNCAYATAPPMPAVRMLTTPICFAKRLIVASSLLFSSRLSAEKGRPRSYACETTVRSYLHHISVNARRREKTRDRYRIVTAVT